MNTRRPREPNPSFEWAHNGMAPRLAHGLRRDLERQRRIGHRVAGLDDVVRCRPMFIGGRGLVDQGNVVGHEHGPAARPMWLPKWLSAPAQRNG